MHTHIYIKKKDLKFRDHDKKFKKDTRVTNVYQTEREICPD